MTPVESEFDLKNNTLFRIDKYPTHNSPKVPSLLSNRYTFTRISQLSPTAIHLPLHSHTTL